MAAYISGPIDTNGATAMAIAGKPTAAEASKRLRGRQRRAAWHGWPDRYPQHTRPGDHW
jgi:hypothetical protein